MVAVTIDISRMFYWHIAVEDLPEPLYGASNDDIANNDDFYKAWGGRKQVTEFDRDPRWINVTAR